MIVDSHLDSDTPNSAIGTVASNANNRFPVPSPTPTPSAIIAGTAITECKVVNSLMKSTANNLRKVIG